ncbi:hypothetical protein ACJMK2_031584 [Sinanodonta woodiana]|uniref:Uncharacterized protein n=1 Tax=Sinanodonta woodiana TaxID=1069815 RepID=A0ABD3WZT1_SINWO
MTRRWDGTDTFPPVNRNVSNVQRIHLLEADLAEIQQETEKLLVEAANLRGYIDMKRVGVQLDWKGRHVVELDYRQVYVEALKKIEQQLKQYQNDSHDCVCRSSDGRVPDTKLKGKDLMLSDLINK